MRSFSKSDAMDWCQLQGAKLGSSGFQTAQGITSPFKIPVDAGRRVALVSNQLRHFGVGDESLVWFDNLAVWPSGQRMHIFERFLASYGEQRPLIEIPAFLFSPEEHEDLVSFVTLGVLFLWDVHVVGTRAQRLAFYSHDEVGWITQ